MTAYICVTVYIRMIAYVHMDDKQKLFDSDYLTLHFCYLEDMSLIEDCISVYREQIHNNNSAYVYKREMNTSIHVSDNKI